MISALEAIRRGSTQRAGLREVRSGGQTGADQGGLEAARVLGLRTGGWAPAGWRTEAGAAPWLAELGLREHPSAEYPPRTVDNVRDSEGTLIFGDATSPGSRMTVRCARDLGRPWFHVPWSSGQPVPTDQLVGFRAWLVENKVQVLNVAGNRESGQPGIKQAVRDFLVAALGGDS